MRLDINSLVTTNVLKINYMHNFFYSQNTNTLIPPTGYILYNIIKIKKKSPPIGLHIWRRKNRYATKVAGCGLRENRLYSMLRIGFWAQLCDCNLWIELWDVVNLVFEFDFMVRCG